MTRPTLLPRRLLAALLVAAAACGAEDPTGPVPPAPVASILLTPADPSLVVGDELALTAIPRDAAGEPLDDRPVAWSSADAAVATVSASGRVLAVAEGRARITATSEGVSSSVEVAVAPVPAAALDLSRGTLSLFEAASDVVAATVRDAQGRPLPGRVVTWTSADPATAIVDEAGVVTGLREGRTTVVAAHGALTASVEVEVRTEWTADLLYDAYAAGESWPRTFVAHPDAATATSIFGLAGTWSAKVSPDGARLVFACYDDGTAICLANRDGSALRVLTAGDLAYEDQPVWSPDGTQIAFRRWPQGATPGAANPTDIWTMNADGTAQANLTADTLVQHTPVWSPVPVGGTHRVLFVQEAADPAGYRLSRLWSARTDGGDRRPVTAEGGHYESQPAWSPDGRTVVFVRTGGAFDGELVARDLVTQEERLLLGAPLAGEQRDPAWTPDGRHLAFTSAHEPSPGGSIRRQVYSVRADGTVLRRRTTSDVDKAGVAWLPRP